MLGLWYAPHVLAEGTIPTLPAGSLWSTMGAGLNPAQCTNVVALACAPTGLQSVERRRDFEVAYWKSLGYPGCTYY